MISFESVTLNRRGTPVLSDLTFDVRPNECVCVTGENGSGKTAILSLILALEKPTHGTIVVDGVDLASLNARLLRAYRRSIGAVFEESLLLPDTTLFENIAFPLRMQGMEHARMRRRVTELLEHAGLSDRAHDRLDSLTYGEKRLAEVLRALSVNPTILLVDEPTSAVDSRTADDIIALLKEAHARGATVIVASRVSGALLKFNARTISLERGRMVRDSGRRTAAAPLPVSS